MSHTLKLIAAEHEIKRFHLFILISGLFIMLFSAPSAFSQSSSFLSSALPPGNVSLELHHSVRVGLAPPKEAMQSLEWIKARGKTDMAAHLIAAMRYSRLGRLTVSEALQELTKNDKPTNWFDWMLWQQAHSEIKPHESYLGFKSIMFYGIDPAFRRFFRPDIEFDIRPEEIVWGGVRVDGIPALDNPKFIQASEASYMKEDDEVFGVEINGDARAYPLRIMGWHEMFNDVIGGQSVSLAYCTLCGAGILFDGEYEGREKFGVEAPFTFGSSGFLYQSNKLMYDRQTDSLWNQFTGEPVSGKLRGSGIKLDIRPVVVTSWAKWRAQHPQTKILDLDTGFRRDYGSGVVYREYFSSPDLMFPAQGDPKKRLENKEQVFGMRLEGGTKAWPLEAFAQGRVLNDKVGLVNVVLIGEAQTRTVRAYERENFEFSGNHKNLTSSDGRKWTLKEDGLHATDGEILKRLPGHVSYWFAWAGYLGDRSDLFQVSD